MATAAGKLGVLRALMREEDLPPAGGHHGDLPDGWSKSLTREIALALALSAQGTEKMMWFAWDLQARLPGIGRQYGNWTLTLPGMRDQIVKLEPVPTFDCDHRRESHAYQPNAMLRHLVQVRDYQCTYPTCSRHARESDFEHGAALRQGREDLWLQRGCEKPPVPHREAVTRLDRYPA